MEEEEVEEEEKEEGEEEEELDEKEEVCSVGCYVRIMLISLMHNAVGVMDLKVNMSQCESRTERGIKFGMHRDAPNLYASSIYISLIIDWKNHQYPSYQS